MNNDVEAYLHYKNLRHFYNKLWLSESLGYTCGPAEIPPKREGWYIIRPIMNLRGMGIGSRKTRIGSNDISLMAPGEFWCELFCGRHLSVTYVKTDDEKGPYHIKHCYEGFKDKAGQFIQWEKTDDAIFAPEWIMRELWPEVEVFNAEFIGNKIIEIHLRDTPDPEVDSMFPVWSGDEIIVDKLEKMGYSYKNSYDDADGFLDRPRLGFMTKNRRHD
jgi:hypothetical protein